MLSVFAANSAELLERQLFGCIDFVSFADVVSALTDRTG